MTDIDHVMKFASEAEAKADPVVGTYWQASNADDPGSWDTSICIPNQNVTQISTASVLPYWYISIARSEIDPVLRDHVACVLITDREAALRGAQFVLFTSLPADQLGDYSIQPVPAGSNYPFGDPDA